MTREREAVARRPAELRARQEEVAAARALQRARLQAEAADVRLAELAAGPDPLLVARKRSAYAEQALTFRNRQLTAEADGFRGQADLDRAVRQENYVRRQLEQRRDSRENLSLRAPCDGVVRYNRAWHDGSFVKVASGVMLGSGMIPLRVADVAGMEVRAEMPERFYDRVRPGQPVAVRIASVSDTPFSGTIAGVDDLFEQKRASETDSGLYSSREPTGETVGYLRVAVTPEAGIRLKPGMVARIAVSAPAGRPGGEP
jgi:multidrug resistance efflux pump